MEQMHNLFNSMKTAISSIDPIAYCESNLTLDGKEFRIHGNGYKPLADIYRYIGIKALEKSSKPIVLVKGRQVGATTMAGALELFFMSSGLFGVGGRAPMRIIHAFPTLIHVFTYAKTKLNPMIKGAKPYSGESKKRISVIEAALDKSSDSSDSLQYKQFMGGNFLRIESTGLDGDRLRGGTVDAIFYDECFPFDQLIKTNDGKIKIGEIYNLFKEGNDIFVESYNEDKKIFEYKKVINVWNRGKRKLSRLICGDGEIKCTGNHKFLTTTGWNQLDDLNQSDFIIGNNKTYQVEYIEKLQEETEVYDIEVEDNHNFIVYSGETELVAHNCQDTQRLAIANANKLLTTSKYGKQGKGIQVYFGTPKQKGSEYYQIWEKSNQQYYHLHCEECEEFFPLYTPGSDQWEDIWIEGKIVKCPHCGKLQDKLSATERGKWVPTRPESECDYIGFHINQLYNPIFDKETIISDKPENNPLMGERTWNNEVLGEFYSGDAGPITIEEIDKFCSDRERTMRESISINEEKLVFAGFDWGKRNDPEAVGASNAANAGGQSYSTAVVLSLTGPSQLSIEFATIIKKNEFEYKKSVINEIMRKYSVTQAVGDIGYANDLSEVMQREHGDKFLASNLVSKVNGYARLNDNQFPKVILAEREYYIQEIFSIMKRGMIRFPYKDWERISWLINHCTSMEVKTTFNSVNEPVRRFIKGGSPNDGFMALLNAYIAYKYYVSGGFKNQKAGLNGPIESKKPLAVVGNFPLFR